MARELQNDYLHNMRFHVNMTNLQGRNYFAADGFPQAGFSAVTTPEVTVEAMEYKEGTMVYTQKYPGNPTTSDITLSRGVSRRDTAFWNWLRVVVEGSGEYRGDLQIFHYHREDVLTREYPVGGLKNLEAFKPDEVEAARTYHLYNAFPIRCKIAGDLDATAADVSIGECDVAYESFEVHAV